MIYDEDPLRRRPRESTARRLRHERCVWMARETTKWPSTRWADYQNHVIGWLQMGTGVPLEMGPVVRFPRIWMSSGECPAQPILHDLLGHRRITLDPGHGYGPEANLERFKNLFGYAHPRRVILSRSPGSIEISENCQANARDDDHHRDRFVLPKRTRWGSPSQIFLQAGSSFGK